MKSTRILTSYGILFSVLVSGIFLQSCVKEIFETADDLDNVKAITWNPAIAVPLINSDLSLDDILRRRDFALIKEDAERLLHLVYEDEIISLRADDLFEIDDQDYDFDFTLTTGDIVALQGAGTVTINQSFVVDYTTLDAEADSLFMKVCNLVLNASSTIEHDCRIKVKFPTISLNGVPLEVELDLTNPTSIPHTASEFANLSGYFFDLTQGSNGYNQLPIDLELTITEIAGNPINIGDNIHIDARILYNDYRVVWGYGLFQDFIGALDTLDLSIFKDALSGSFTVEEPRFVVGFSNSYGVPMEVRLIDVNSLSNGIPIALTGLPDPLPIPSPSKAQMGLAVVDSLVLDHTNSNIATIISTQPDGITYNLSGTLNPPGTTERNFMMDSSTLRVRVGVDIPLYGTASDFVLQEDQDFTLDFGDNVDEIEYALFRVNLDNGFPVELDFQLFFADSLNNIIDSLFTPDELTMPSGIVDGSGRVTEPTRTTRDIRVDGDRIREIQKGDKIITRAGLNTTFNGSGGQDPVKIYADYSLGIKLGVQAKAKVIQGLTE